VARWGTAFIARDEFIRGACLFGVSHPSIPRIMGGVAMMVLSLRLLHVRQGAAKRMGVAW
jgi:hypothetical protein